MKILHVSDLHGRLPWLRWLVRESAKYDLVCVTGDILDLGGIHCVPETQIQSVSPYLHAMRAPVALCSGNHDIVDGSGKFGARWMEKLRRKDVFIDSETFHLGNYSFRIIGWCEPVPTESLQDFWLCHPPPFGARTSTVAGGVSHGCQDLASVCLGLRGPRCLLGGHVHCPLSFFSVMGGTLSVNPGRGIDACEPNRIVIDLKRKLVTHHQPTREGLKSQTVALMFKDAKNLRKSE